MMQTEGPETLIGHEVGGYELLRILGQGVMGAVYLGEYRRERLASSPAASSASSVSPGSTQPLTLLGGQVAVKVLLLPWQMTTHERDDFRLRFRREAQVLLTLRHPHILPLISFGEDSPLPYMVLPYLSGGTLQALRGQAQKMQHPVPLTAISHDLTYLAQALDYAHQRKIIHRDIKPSNILYNQEGTVFLADFSLAALQATSQTTLTTMGAILGTPLYIAPELVQEQEASPATDVYSLGVVLYELVAGRPPFQGTVFELFMKHVSASPPPLYSLRPDLPAETEAVIMRALAKRPEHRFDSAGELARAFAASLPPVTRAAPSMPHYLHTDRLANVLRLIEMGHETGLLLAVRDHESQQQVGEVAFTQGHVVYAAVKGHKADVAFTELYNWGACSFAFLTKGNALTEMVTMTIHDWILSEIAAISTQTQ
ncbi:MAG TPA: serine/threonine-protein kinase [Ktedonobacterales bacterium]|nr:serine/threonine-protein kinase [Ktedonobacterales bacterium]